MLCPLAAVAFCLPAVAFGAELRIGLAEAPSALDPHYHDDAPNNVVRRHIFDSLVYTDAALRLAPGLATSWRALDDNRWEFKLRQGVRFHDGSPFSADDVVFTLERIPTLAGSPASFAVYTGRITEIETPDPYTVIFKTARPTPLLPVDMAQFGILSRKAAEGLGSDELNHGRGLVGTGPYRFVGWDRGRRITLEAYDGYWGGREPWRRVVLESIAAPEARVQALRDGRVDVIEAPPPQALARLKDDPELGLAFGLSSRLIYLQFDHAQEPTPGVGGSGGKNPFKDRQVRAAFSKAIDRRALVDEVLSGLGMPASQLVPPGMFGYDGALEVERYDPAAAKALLAAAGYGDGFALSLAAPDDRYAFGGEVAEAVAAMLRQIGIKAQPALMNRSEFFPRRNRLEFSFYLGGFSTNTGEASAALAALLATPDSERGLGRINRGQYSNPKLDGLINLAAEAVDEGERAKLLAEAHRLAIQDHALLPLYYEVAAWGLRRGLWMWPRADRQTTAMSVRPPADPK
jgi:peptide/nickel transport system substrate-binding protein